MAIKNLLTIKKHLFICSGGTCKTKGSEESILAIRSKINELGLCETIHTTKTLCNGRCKDGPIIIGMPDGIWFKQVFPSEVEGFSNTFLVSNQLPEKHLLYQYNSDTIYPVATENILEIKA